MQSAYFPSSRGVKVVFGLHVTRQREKKVISRFKLLFIRKISELKPKFNNGETKNPFHEFSFKHSSIFSSNHCHFIFFSLMFSTGSESQEYCKM